MVNLSSCKKIKVMFIMDNIFGITGGTENQTIKIINNLDHNKYELYLLCFRNTPWMKENMSKLRCTVKAFSYNIFNHKDPRNLLVFVRAVQYIRKVNPDLVMTLFKISYILGVLAARLAGVKNILSTRRDYGLWLDGRSIYLLRFANRFVKRIVTNSFKVKELTSEKEKYESSKIDVIYNGIDFDEIKHNADSRQSLKEMIGIPPNSKVIGIVASLRPMKRHKTFLQAAARVLKIRADIHFVIVGGGPLKKELEDFAVTLGMERQVHFVGLHDDVKPFLSIFDVGVNCSSNEGLSNAIMEYMTYGVPCIVSNAGGNPELIENGFNGHTFELDNDKELANLMINLLQDSNKQEEFVLRSKEIIRRRMNLKGMIDNYDNIFTEVAG